MASKEKSKKMTLPELKQHLRKLTQTEAIDLICRLYKSSPEAGKILNIEFNREQYLALMYEEAKAKILKQFFPSRGMGRLSLRDAKNAISDFKKISVDPEPVLDLQLYYVECGVDFSKQYEGMNESFYYSMGNMFSTVVETLNKLNDEALFRHFEERMRNILSVEERDPGFADEFRAFDDLKWVREDGEEVVSEAKDRIVEVDVPSGPALSAENARRFYEIMMPLESWVNRKYQVFPELGDTFTEKDINISQVRELMNTLWSHSDAIGDYITECGQGLSDADREIVSGWKRFIHGRFLIERYLKAGAVFIPVEGKGRVYLVSGITNGIEENIPKNALPVMVETTLIPFMGRIIYDGLLIPFSVMFGGGIKRSLKESYLEAKREERIVTKL